MTRPVTSDFGFGPDVEEILASVSDDERGRAAVALMGTVAAQLSLLIGTREASAIAYALADTMATQGVGPSWWGIDWAKGADRG